MPPPHMPHTPPHLELEFEVTHEDWIALMRRQAVTEAVVDRVHQRIVRASLISSAAFVLAVGAIAYFAASNRSTAPANAAIFMVLMALASFFISRRKLTRANARKRMERDLDRLMRQGTFGELKAGPLRLTFTDDDAVSMFDGQTISFPWSAAREVERYEDALIVNFAGKGMIRVPERVFSSEAERDHFIETVDQLRLKASARSHE